MVLLTITPVIQSAIDYLGSASNDAVSLPDPVEVGAPISHGTLISLSRVLKQRQKQNQSSSAKSHTKHDFSLNSLLHTTSIYNPPPPPKPAPSSEYVALMARLKREQELKEYYNLTSKEEQYQDQLLGEEEKDNISPSLVLNILLSVVLCAVVGFQLSSHVFPHNDGMRVLCALGTGIIVGVAEVVVYAAYLRKVSEAKRKEKSRKEVKTMLVEDQSSELEGSEGLSVEKESEEIWGRGVHGGVRRRVQDKWRKEQIKERKS